MSWPYWGVMSVTLFKLSIHNARRQAQDYLVYFVTIVLVAALVYAFNGLVFSQELLHLSSAIQSLPLMIVLASVVVVFIIGWLVYYTIGFMLSRRSRELGTYILTGIENRQVARLFFLENAAVGGIALALGIFLGNFLFQILRAVMLALFKIPYTFSFAFSVRAIGLTLVYFAIIYLFALYKCRRRIRTMKICELIYYDRQNEREVIEKNSLRQKIFILSILCGVIGTILLLLQNLAMGILGSGLIILFLYGFFASFSSGVPAWFEKRPEKKYQGCTLLIFRSLSTKLATMGVVMATIALLFTATLISEGSGLLFHAMFQSRSEQTTCFDLFIGSTSANKDHFNDYLAYIDTNIPIQDKYRYHIYQAESMQVTDYIRANTRYWGDYEYDTLMKASDYAALRSMLGYSAVPFAPGEYRIHCMAYMENLLKKYQKTITVGETTLQPGDVLTENFTQSLWNGNGRGFVLIVPDEIAEGRPLSHSIYAAMTQEPVPMQNYNALVKLRDEKNTSVLGYDTIFSRAAIAEENAALYAMIVFPLYYLALVLTMVSATILTIQQLSETARYRHQFALLEKLGMDRKEMKKALLKQFALYYTMPAIPPLFISVPFIYALGSTFDPGTLAGIGHLLSILATTLGLFFCIYFLYILMAYVSLKRNVFPSSI